jgi:phage terminase small subunit
MPTQVVSVNTMGIGKKRGGKHWTDAQTQARAAAAQDFERKDDAKLTPPEWMSKSAVEIWDRKLTEIAGLNAGSELLDALDSEMLATFCDAMANYILLAKRKRKTVATYKTIQAYHRILIQASERLGFTPGARARLIKKRADGGKADVFGEQFD